ncbi:MAG: small multi-drug export protein [Eubacteriales bacterium]
MLFNTLVVLFLSMVPVIELRGAIPVGLISGLGYPLTLTTAIIGNLVPIPFLIVYGRRVLVFLAGQKSFGGLFRWMLNLGEKKVASLKKTLFLSLWVFVAVPLPGTGAWTGALIAITLNLKLKQSLPAIALGVLTAAAIVTVMYFAFDIMLF